ncbi:MAG: MerR family DNA-binding transcriptional regulator [PVC group bacterium]|nr:MerR family DNA-binding transcriptional regulator [PVC group bacterium]
MMERFFSIGEVAQRLGISVQTIRRYEKLGKFPEPRRNKVNNRREYTQNDIIKRLKILGRSIH